MTRLDEFVTVKEASEFLGASANALGSWHRPDRIPVYRNPISNDRLFKKTELEELLKQIEKSGEYLTGWKRNAKRNRKPR